MKKFVAALSLSFGLVIAVTPAVADTLYAASSGGEIVGGEYVYPYNFNINGSTQQAQLMCLDFNRHIRFGETWNVDTTKVALDGSQDSVNYRADAWIYSQLGSYSNADVQYAVWDIFDPQDVKGHDGFTSTAQSLAATGMQMATNEDLIDSGFYSQFSLYRPTADQTGWTDGKPQDFLGIAVAPEPSSFVLLGTGLLGIAGTLRRRLARG